MLLTWLHLKSSAMYIIQLLPVACHGVYGKNFQTTVSQNFLAVLKAKSLKNCLLPIAAIVLSQEYVNYETA